MRYFFLKAHGCSNGCSNTVRRGEYQSMQYLSKKTYQNFSSVVGLQTAGKFASCSFCQAA